MWNRLSEVGPLYPGVGWEIPLTTVVCLVWIGWMIWQVRHENAEYDERVRQLRGSRSDAPKGAGRDSTAGASHGSETS